MAARYYFIRCVQMNAAKTFLFGIFQAAIMTNFACIIVKGGVSLGRFGVGIPVFPWVGTWNAIHAASIAAPATTPMAAWYN